MNRITTRWSRWALVGVVVLIAFGNSGKPLPAAARSMPPFDRRDHPVHLLASYFDAVTRQDYARAYDYWTYGLAFPDNESLFKPFVAGFADVRSMRALARLPVTMTAHAGAFNAAITFADVPVVVLTTLKSGEGLILAGCFQVLKFNASAGDPNWYLSFARLEHAMTVDFEHASGLCTTVESFPTPWPTDNQRSPIDVISSYYDAIAARDYTRAYSYWMDGAPGQTSQFAQGLAGIDHIEVVVALSFNMGITADGAYASIPLLITTTHNGESQSFAGCLVTRQSPGPVGDDALPDPNWYLHQADIQAVNAWDSGVWDVCSSLKAMPGGYGP
jgi:hypothetical protein